MKLVLHIGTPKTGTTSLQRFLYQNRVRLSRNGYVLFDDVGGENNSHLPAYFSRNGLNPVWRARLGIKDTRDKDAYFKSIGFPQSLVNQFIEASSSHHTAVISSEHFSSSLSQPQVATLANWIRQYFSQIRVICYVRSQPDRITSGWSTHLGAGGHHSLEKFIDNAISSRRLDYFALAGVWSSAFGPENVMFREYQGRGGWDVRREFSAKFLTEATHLEFSPQRSNESYRNLEAQGIRVINRFIPLWNQGMTKRNSKNILARKVVSRIWSHRGSEIVLSPSQIQRIEEAYAASNKEFAKTFLSRAELS